MSPTPKHKYTSDYDVPTLHRKLLLRFQQLSHSLNGKNFADAYARASSGASLAHELNHRKARPPETPIDARIQVDDPDTAATVSQAQDSYNAGRWQVLTRLLRDLAHHLAARARDHGQPMPG